MRASCIPDYPQREPGLRYTVVIQMNLARSVVAALAMFLFAPSDLASQSVGEAQLKAEFVERFMRFVEWPSDSPAEAKPLVVGVLGESSIHTHLSRIASQRTVHGRPMVVVRLDDVSDAADCAVVVLGENDRLAARELAQVTSRRPVLTISEHSGLMDEGLIVGFYRSGDKLRFEINEKAARAHGLRVSSKLLSLARIVGGAP